MLKDRTYKYKPSVVRDAVADAVMHVLAGRNTAVVFLPPLKSVTRRVRARAVTYEDGSTGGCVVVSVGRPNYEEREFLRMCRKAKCKPRRMWFPNRRPTAAKKRR